MATRKHRKVARDNSDGAIAHIDLTKPGGSSSPALPHERDESVGMTDAAPNERVRQGQLDVQRGVQDTSRAPEADRAYQKQKQTKP